MRRLRCTFLETAGPAKPLFLHLSTTVSVSSSSSSSHLGLSIFSIAWAVYALIHLAVDLHRWFYDPLPLVLGIVSGAAAISLLVRPSSLGRLGLLVVAWSAQKVYFMPFIPNHVFLTLCTHLILLLSLGWAFATRNSASKLSSRFYETFAPLVRIEILILYFFAVFHKLNTDFFDAAVSCGWMLYQEITELFPLLPTSEPIPFLTIYGTVGLEALIPILLLFRRTRLWGVGLGIAFHFLLTLGARPYVASFSTHMIAVYTLFLSATFHEVLWERVRALRIFEWGQSMTQGARNHRWKLLGGMGLLIGALIAAELLLDGWLFRRLAFEAQTVGLVGYFLWAISAFLLFGGSWLALRKDGSSRLAALRSSQTAFFRPVLTPGLVILLVVLLNGFSPYLGLKTEMSFSMFSNLRTEAGVSNHLFFPVLSRGNGYQDDLVTVLDGSAPWIGTASRKEQRIPFFKLRRLASRSPAPNTWIEYKHGGETVLVQYAEDPEHKIFQPLPFWERKFLRFRPLPPSDNVMTCGH